MADHPRTDLELVKHYLEYNLENCINPFYIFYNSIKHADGGLKIRLLLYSFDLTKCQQLAVTHGCAYKLHVTRSNREQTIRIQKPAPGG